MTEPTGFTGIDWCSRGADRLRADLMAGAGPASLADCADAWEELAAELDALLGTTRRAVDALGEGWSSAGAEAVAGVLARLPVWLDAVVRRTRQQCALTAGALAAAESARLAMPAAAAIDAAQARLVDLARNIGLAALMTGGLARAERAGTELAASAARVMADYERDSTTVATAPPRRQPSPQLVRGAHRPSALPVTVAASAARWPGTAALPAAHRVLGHHAPAAIGVRVAGGPRPTPVAAGKPAESGDPVPRAGALGPMAPLTGTPAAAVRGGCGSPSMTPAPSSGAAGTAAGGPAEPVTWAQLAVHDGVRVGIGSTTTDPDHTSV